MPIDPSIITSGNQMPQIRLPDVNAMMQTRTAGMENIYKMEQARAAQAQAAQKEQEAALVEALTPAYATAYKGGGTKEALTAAVSLLPPEMQTKIAPTVEKLMALPSDDLRLSALETSLANGGAAGRAILDRIPTEIQRMNAEVQRGQLDIARQKLAMEQQQLAQGPAGEYATVETDKGIFVINKKTGEIRPAVAEGIPGPRAESGTAAEGPIDVAQPPGILQPKAKKDAAATESERTAGYNAGRALNAAERIAKAVKEDPTAAAPETDEALMGMVVDPNIVRSGPRQRAAAAQRDLIDALLTLATGAAYNREQLEGQMQSYIPRWSDDDATRADKQQALLDLISAAKVKAGRAWTPEMDDTFQKLLTPPESSGTSGKDADLDALLNKYLPKQ